MVEDKKEQEGDLNEIQRMAMENMHKTFLEALRHREQEILRFLAILAPSLCGFIWLLTKGVDAFVFTIGTLGILFFLLLGAVYSLALGYNFRYITLQLAKMESDNCLGIRGFMLKRWLRTPKKWKKKSRASWIPYCTPPEIIKVFWLAFVIAEIFITFAACFFLWNRCENICIIIIGGIFCIIIAVLLAPMFYGWKLHKICDKEPDEWKKSHQKKEIV